MYITIICILHIFHPPPHSFPNESPSPHITECSRVVLYTPLPVQPHPALSNTVFSKPPPQSTPTPLAFTLYHLFSSQPLKSYCPLHVIKKIFFIFVQLLLNHSIRRRVSFPLLRRYFSPLCRRRLQMFYAVLSRFRGGFICL